MPTGDPAPKSGRLKSGGMLCLLDVLVKKGTRRHSIRSGALRIALIARYMLEPCCGARIDR